MSSLIATQKLEPQKFMRYEIRIQEDMLWQMKQVAAVNRFDNTAEMVRSVLKQYISSELKTVKAAEAAKG